MKTIKISDLNEVPNNFTGVAEYSANLEKWYLKYWFKEGIIHREDGPAIEWVNGNKYWYKEGNCHRSDGPAIERLDKSKEWWVDGQLYLFIDIEVLIETSIYLGKEKGKYDLDWLRFLTDEGIEEFPIIPGMEEDKKFKPLFDQVFGAPIT